MYRAHFRFHGGLNFFLPPRKKNKTIVHEFDWRASIKDMIESLGPPHPEIDLLTVNGRSVDFSYVVRPDDDINVYSDFDAVDLPVKIPLRPPLEHKARFVLDTHLGRLASYLRMLGFDTLYRNDYPDDELAQVSAEQERILLTRDIGLLKRGIVTYGYYVRNTNPKKRIAEVITRYNLLEQAEPFKHCMKCNGLLQAVDKETIIEELPPRTANFYDEFHRCLECERIYWKGSHYQRMQTFIDVLQVT